MRGSFPAGAENEGSGEGSPCTKPRLHPSPSVPLSTCDRPEKSNSKEGLCRYGQGQQRGGGEESVLGAASSGRRERIKAPPLLHSLLLTHHCLPPAAMWRILLATLLFAATKAHGCGVPAYSPFGRVVNGEDAVPYSWPWQVSLQYENNGEFRHTCGGSLIAPKWVMTAGHCISSSRNYRVVLGEYDRSREEGTEQNIPVNSGDIFVHPDWNSNCLSCGNDIALLRLSREAELNDEVQLGCLPPPGEILPNGQPCYISGWGRLYTGGPLPSILQQALLPVVDHQHCTQPDWWGATVKENMVCAGGDTRAGCNGDSGGPLNCQGADGRWYVHGVTSFVSSMGCDTLKKPTVFTRASAFNAWIEETIASNP